MTPAETEHFAALRMHVARLHAALKETAETFVPEDSELRGRVAAALDTSEPDVLELLKEADRDAALMLCRAEKAAAIDASIEIGRYCRTVEAGALHLVAVYRREDAGSEEWAGDLTAAVEDLAKLVGVPEA